MKYKILTSLLLLTGFCKAQVQSHLDQLFTFNVQQQRVKDVLQLISNTGDFYFSFNGKLIKQDSLVSLNVNKMPLREVLDQLFKGNVDYKENAGYIILRYAVNHFTIEPEQINISDKLYEISGYIIDVQTRKSVKQASVYEKRLLQSTLTNDEGYFNLRFKGDHKEIILTASKEMYRDTSLIFLADVKVIPRAYDDPNKEKGTAFSGAVEELGIGRFLLSARQRIQSLNIPNFFANAPFQAAIIPGWSSQGMMSSRMVNKVSLNVFGGYTAGVNGVEVAGLFNFTAKDVQFFQAAGLLNALGGSMKGAQFAGLHNYINQNINGLQAAGLMNWVKGEARGVQLAGLTNLVHKNMGGWQAAGLANFVVGNTKGTQIAGLGNFSTANLTGTQIAGVFNYAKHLKGLQIGLINLADTNSGTSIGLINLSKNGYKKISLFANDVVNANIAVKTGNANLYTILIAGKNYADTAKVETFGAGFGRDFIFSKTFSLAAEITGQYLYLGSWDYTNILTRFQTNLQVKLSKNLSVFAGPSYVYYHTDQPVGSGPIAYKQQVVPQKHHQYSGNRYAWLGWNVGVTIF